MRRIAFACAVALQFHSAADAQTLYKCVARASVSYQQTPCPTATRTVRTIETTPERPPTAAERAARDRKARQDRAESAFLSHVAGTDRLAVIERGCASRGVPTRALRRRARNHIGNGTACEAAKANRERTLRRVGFERNIDLLRRLDAEVAEACGPR
jgi:hypothetical protein